MSLSDEIFEALARASREGRKPFRILAGVPHYMALLRHHTLDSGALGARNDGDFTLHGVHLMATDDDGLSIMVNEAKPEEITIRSATPF